MTKSIVLVKGIRNEISPQLPPASAGGQMKGMQNELDFSY